MFFVYPHREPDERVAILFLSVVVLAVGEAGHGHYGALGYNAFLIVPFATRTNGIASSATS